MTTEQQRIAIAEACGIKVVTCSCGGLRDEKEERHVPSYLTDLNAMHEAEKVLRADDCHSGDISSITFYESLIGKRSSAAKRAEAFLKTIGKWIE